MTDTLQRLGDHGPYPIEQAGRMGLFLLCCLARVFNPPFAVVAVFRKIHFVSARPAGVILFAGTFASLLLLSGVTVEAATPTEQVRDTVDNVIATLEKTGDDREGRRAQIRSIIRARFDFRAMSQRTLASEWQRASKDQQDRFVRFFTDLLEKTYIGRIEAYQDERVEYRRERQKGDRARVDTVVVAKGVEIPMTYRMVHRGGEWFVYDVVIEEVSLIRNFRSTYREIIRREGLDGLLAKMEAKIAATDLNESSDNGK